MAAARYVALNPVRARLVARAEDWPWSSVRAHLEGRNDALVHAAPLSSRARPAASPIFLTTNLMPKRPLPFGRPKASADRSAPRPSSIGWPG